MLKDHYKPYLSHYWNDEFFQKEVEAIDKGELNEKTAKGVVE